MQIKHVTILIRILSVVVLLLGGLGFSYQPAKGATTFTVDTLNDEEDFSCADGDCSLRDAIGQSSAGDTIDFSVNGTITLSNALKTLNINNDLTVEGPGASSLTISGQDNFRVFHVGNATVAISDLTVKDGGLFNSGTLTLDQVVVTDSQMDINGAGIYNLNTLTMQNCTVSDNQVTSSVSNGGGIYNVSDLAINGSTIRGNTAIQDGGGIYNTGTLDVIDTEVNDNQGRYGGGLYNNKTMRLTNVTIRGNDGEYGGGINSDDAGDVTLKDSDVSDNEATENGGGLRNRGVFSITNTTLYTNTSPAGGGIYNLADGELDLVSSVVGDNDADGHAGGVYNLGTMTINNSTISGNEAKGESKIGGGIWNAGGTLDLKNSTVSGNIASGNGGGIYTEAILNASNVTVSGNVTGQHGGGIYHKAETLRLDNITIVNNSVNGQIGNGGGIALKGGTLKIKNTLIGDNTAAKEDMDCFNWAGPFDNRGFNLVENPHESCVFEHNKDITGQAPKVGTLADNGGETQTHALMGGSPAIDNGDCTDIAGLTVTMDQRGNSRPQGSACDIGAFEGQGSGYNLYLPLISR